MTDSIPVFKPLLEEEEHEACRRTLAIGWLGMGSFVDDFERALEAFLEIEDDRHVVAVSTGHAALHLSLMALGVGPGDEVITPSFNNITDFQAILAVGATPVLCDIEDASLCLDVERAAELISPRTKAIIATDYACMFCDHDRLAQLADAHGLRVIHDAAHAFGSRLGGRMAGANSDVAVFSFDPVKTITSIDGGAIVVEGGAARDLLRELRLVGMGQPADVMYRNQRAWTYDVQRLGFRYHLANLHAAIGLAQLAKMDRISSTRRAACRELNARLGGLSWLRVPQTDFEDVTPFLYYVRVPAERRRAFRDHVHARGVDTGVHWQPGHAFTLLGEVPRGDLSVTERVASEIVTLPLHSAMAEADLEAVVQAVSSFAEG